MKRMIFKEDKIVSNFNAFNPKTLALVIVLHVVGVAGLYALPESKQTPVAETCDKSVDLESQTNIQSTEQPQPHPLPNPLPPSRPKATPSPTPSSEKVLGLTSSYTVKKGDTFYSIVKKYKLNPSTLIKLNNIKDPNKLTQGQTLKFVK